MRRVIAFSIIVMLTPGKVDAAGNGTDQFSPQEGFSWTGLYLGGSLGWAQTVDDDPAFPAAPGVTFPLHSEGRNDNVGVHVGYNYQFDNFVVGAEYEFRDVDIQFVGDGIGPIPVFIQDTHTIKARFGYAFNRALPYVNVGGLHADINTGLSDWVYSAGIGIDFAIADNILLGMEYSHAWFDKFDTTLIEGTLDQYSIRLSYKF